MHDLHESEFQKSKTKLENAKTYKQILDWIRNDEFGGYVYRCIENYYPPKESRKFFPTITSKTFLDNIEYYLNRLIKESQEYRKTKEYNLRHYGMLLEDLEKYLAEFQIGLDKIAPLQQNPNHKEYECSIEELKSHCQKRLDLSIEIRVLKDTYLMMDE